MLFTLVMSFSDAQAMILSGILTTTRPRESTLAAKFEAKSTMVVAGCNVTTCWDAVALPPPFYPHCSATT
jgi:hypothetical protein